MSVVDQFTFTRSLEVLNSPSLVSLLSCSLCSKSLSTTTTLSSGQCHHAICQDCLSSSPGGVCPVEACDIPAHPRDYKENRTLGQLAMCLGNIRNLLGHKENTAHGTEVGDAPGRNHKSAKPKTKDDTAENNKNSAVKLKENKADPETKHERKRTGRNIKSMNKQSANKDASSPYKPENEETSMKSNPEDDASGKAASKDDVDTMDKKPTETNVDIKLLNKKQSRLSLPVGKKAKPSRVRSATTSGQPGTNPSKLNMSTTTTVVSNMEKKNKKGESVLHASCVKGCLETVLSLLAAGASPNTQDNAGWTPLHEAASAGRLDMARVLLEAGARPSVPSKEERVTPLHDAVGSAQVEMVKLLVSRGANRDARDSKGNTPRVMAVKVGNHVMDVLENTVVEVQEEDFMETILQPQDVVLCLSTKVAVNLKLVKALTEAATKLGCSRKPSSQLRDDMTHLLVEEEEEDQSLNALAALVLGAEIVSVAWLLESMKQDRVVSCLQYRCEGKGVEGARKGRLRRASNQPGLFAGLHFFLTGTFEPPCFTKAEVQNMVKMAGGKVITREPDPEFIPSQEDTVPHHALISSSIASTSHVILYLAGGKREPMIKYNMKHVKTLPVSWLLSCITSGYVTDPAGLSV